jgi:hypothetical protein
LGTITNKYNKGKELLDMMMPIIDSIQDAIHDICLQIDLMTSVCRLTNPTRCLMPVGRVYLQTNFGTNLELIGSSLRLFPSS